MAHEPFPIADFRSGQFSGKEPWLSPASAFQTLTDGRIYRGRLEKRRGYSRLSELGVAASTINGSGPGPNSTAIYAIVNDLSPDGLFNNLIPETAVFAWPDGCCVVFGRARFQAPEHQPAGDPLADVEEDH